MKRHILTLTIMLLAAMTFTGARAQNAAYDQNVDYGQRINQDRYLKAEIWTSNDDYYEGDNITISFRTNRDAYVAIYNIDTRGNVNLLYPTSPNDDGHIQGDRVYQIPGSGDQYELNVQGPVGTEYLHIVASREPLQIPDWFNGSGLVSNDAPEYFMDYVDDTYFGCVSGDCPRATDMTSFRVKEWQNYYFHPVYHYDYPDWSYCGSVYIDYPIGATIYIDGIYWGCAPLFIPRIYFGYHWFTVYDRFGYCWENRVNVYRYRSVILDQAVVRTRPDFKSRYREVATRGYLDPIRHGYPNFQKEVRVKETFQTVAKQQRDQSLQRGNRGTMDGNYPNRGQSDAGKRGTYDTGRRGTVTDRGRITTGRQPVGPQRKADGQTYDRTNRPTQERPNRETIDRTNRGNSAERRSTAPYKGEQNSRPAYRQGESSRQGNGRGSETPRVAPQPKPSAPERGGNEGRSSSGREDGGKKGR